jgi:hypothetical protein
VRRRRHRRRRCPVAAAHDGEDNFQTSGLHYKRFTIVVYDRNDMAGTIRLNYDRLTLASVVNYDHKRDATIWSINLMSSFTFVICLLYKPLGPVL